VVEFGTEKAPARRRRWIPSGVGRSLAADRRVVPLTAALAAVAVLASLISEWQVTTVDAAQFGGGETGTRAVPTSITDVGSLGAGFLTGLFPLVVAVVLVLFGPPAARRWVRLVGLSVGGTLLGLLLATAAALGDESRVVPELYNDPYQIEIGYGRGLWCAAAGVLLAMVALYLSDRSLPADWARRRPAASEDQQPVDEPLELTVGPAKPFTSFGDGAPSFGDDRGNGASGFGDNRGNGVPGFGDDRGKGISG
jgi:hypothetical protein